MEFFVQPRRESSVHQQRDRFFHHERLSQYAPYAPVEETTPWSIEACKQYLSALIWPRLAVIRVKHVLTELMPLLNLTADGTCGGLLSVASTILSPLGWVLHGLRLFINVLQLLQDALFHREQGSVCSTEVVTHLQRHGASMGNDLIWGLAAILPTTFCFTLTFFVVDILWLSGRAWFETARLKGLRDGIDAATQQALLTELTNNLVFKQRKFLLNLGNLVSISTLTMLRGFVLPTILPLMAANPVLLLTFSVLSLLITVVTHLLGQALARQNRCNVDKKTNNACIPLKLPAVNEDDFCESINTPHTSQAFNIQ